MGGPEEKVSFAGSSIVLPSAGCYLESPRAEGARRRTIVSTMNVLCHGELGKSQTFSKKLPGQQKASREGLRQGGWCKHAGLELRLPQGMGILLSIGFRSLWKANDGVRSSQWAFSLPSLPAFLFPACFVPPLPFWAFKLISRNPLDYCFHNVASCLDGGMLPQTASDQYFKEIKELYTKPCG